MQLVTFLWDWKSLPSLYVATTPLWERKPNQWATLGGWGRVQRQTRDGSKRIYKKKKDNIHSIESRNVIKSFKKERWWERNVIGHHNRSTKHLPLFVYAVYLWLHTDVCALVTVGWDDCSMLPTFQALPSHGQGCGVWRVLSHQALRPSPRPSMDTWPPVSLVCVNLNAAFPDAIHHRGFSPL